ncbi:MAG: stage III sporulation protein AG [Ruminococcaceae bacterium]|nr:stage III sporulation protein AG [Oscillospiraceae bacterium]
MERGQFLNLKAIGETFKKFKYPALILLLGAVLLLWPSKKETESEVTQPLLTETIPSQGDSTQAEMENILSCIDGAGEVRVLLTRKTGDETLYLTDTTESENSDGGSSRTQSAVRVNVSGGGEAPVITKTVYGQYQGALVVCEGADSAEVRLKLVNAVASLTGLSADRVTVIKMKS